MTITVLAHCDRCGVQFEAPVPDENYVVLTCTSDAYWLTCYEGHRYSSDEPSDGYCEHCGGELFEEV
jgi:hypothetical protein